MTFEDLVPDHEYGFTGSYLKEHLDEQQFKRFVLWMGGQTAAWVDGETVYYAHDFHRWARAGTIID